jgi:hypothetical protein
MIKRPHDQNVKDVLRAYIVTVSYWTHRNASQKVNEGLFIDRTATFMALTAESILRISAYPRYFWAHFFQKRRPAAGFIQEVIIPNGPAAAA